MNAREALSNARMCQQALWRAKELQGRAMEHQGMPGGARNTQGAETMLIRSLQRQTNFERLRERYLQRAAIFFVVFK